ncbi:MAG: cyclic pyranopterin monophosphate synthase MoaC [Caldisphaera sp.]|nr:cyclic pyranopterin monophosphate synthase MoaC [Caldisphaera sp.]PMP90389.1 MAG: cyclic pyranopterin monophosphate synthase MoaC [Caldisphaera sp.]
MAHMVDVTNKPIIYREAIASGEIKLKEETIRKIKNKEIEKGDVEAVSSVAAILAAKDSSKIIPLVHPLPITNVDVNFDYSNNSIKVIVKVKTKAETGVEMDALAGVMAALLTIWDMTKQYEKDEKGLYPNTQIFNVKVENKIKRNSSLDI